MVFLLGSIVLTSWLTLAFKLAERLGLNVFQVIAFNYLCCVITGSVFIGRFPISSAATHQAWFPWAIVIGLMFIVTFNLVAATTNKLGVSAAAVAFKLSLVIPFLFSLWLYGERVSVARIAGIVLAMVAVYLTVKRFDSPTTSQRNGWIYLIPVLLFVGSGLVDTMVKYVEQHFLDESNSNDFLVTAFAAAAFTGQVVLLFQVLSGKMKYSIKAVLMGVAIGIPNYFSIWCLVKVLKKYPGNSSTIIPINNMGIVLFSALMALVMFHEKLKLLNWLGILLALCAIALVAFG